MPAYSSAARVRGGGSQKGCVFVKEEGLGLGHTHTHTHTCLSAGKYKVVGVVALKGPGVIRRNT